MAFELRICDWGSDVCSSDLFCAFARKHPGLRGAKAARRASDNNHLVLQSVGHFPLLFVDFIPPTRRPAVRSYGVSGAGGREHLPGQMAEDALLDEAREDRPFAAPPVIIVMVTRPDMGRRADRKSVV